MRLEISANGGEDKLGFRERVFSASDRARTIEVEFNVPAYKRGVEFRTEVFGDFEGAIESFDLTPLAVSKRRWSASDAAISLLQGRRSGDVIEIGPDVRGRVIYGPYEAIEPGAYELKFLFTPGTSFGRCRAEICVSRGNKYLHVHDAGEGREGNAQELSFNFVVENEYDDFEFRLEVLEPFSGGVAAVELLMLDFAPQEAD